MPRTAVVVPTYQEAANIVELLHRVRAAAPDVQVFVADDGSPDGTADLARAAADELGSIEVLVNPEKSGLGGAYRRTFAQVLDRGYERIVQMDADLSHDPSVIPQLLACLDSGKGLAVGSRYIPGGKIPHWPWHRRFLSRYGNLYACTVLGLPVRDATSGYRAFEASTLRAIDFGSTRATGYGFQIECAYRVAQLGIAFEEVPITFTDRLLGYSKMTTRIAAEELVLVTWWALRNRVLRRPPSWSTPKG